MLFNNTFLCLRGKMSIFNIMTELKLVLPVNTTGHRSKIILSPANICYPIYNLTKHSLPYL